MKVDFEFLSSYNELEKRPFEVLLCSNYIPIPPPPPLCSKFFCAFVWGGGGERGRDSKEEVQEQEDFFYLKFGHENKSEHFF